MKVNLFVTILISPSLLNFYITRLFEANMSPDEMILEKREPFGIFLLSKHGRSRLFWASKTQKTRAS